VFQGQLIGIACNLLMAGSLIAVVPVLIVAMFAWRKWSRASPWVPSARRNQDGGTCV